MEERQTLERQMDYSKQSIDPLLERTSKRLREIRALFQVEQHELPRFRISRCSYFIYRTQESLNKGLATFYSNHFPETHAYLEEAMLNLDSVERLLNKKKRAIKNNQE